MRWYPIATIFYYFVLYFDEYRDNILTFCDMNITRSYRLVLQKRDIIHILSHENIFISLPLMSSDFFVIIGYIFVWFLALLALATIILVIFDRFFQGKNIIMANFPALGRMRYFFHELRPFFRQYFGDDNAFAPRVIIDWILDVSHGKSGYFSFDPFDTTNMFQDPSTGMIHSNAPRNNEEMDPQYPLVGTHRKHPLQFHTYFYRSAMSLGALSFEATTAMAKACANVRTVFNTGEGWLSIHHLPNLPYDPDKKFFLTKKLPAWTKFVFKLAPGIRMKNRFIERCGNHFEPEKGERNLFLFCKTHWTFYSIDREAPLEHFPKPKDLTDEYGHLVLQVGSGLYGLRKKSDDPHHLEIDRDRFQKVASFVRAIEIKIAQGAKQTWGMLKKEKNTHTIATIRGVKQGIDLMSPNRFPYYDRGDEDGFLDFVDKLSDKAWGKPVGCKIVIAGRDNIEPLAAALARRPLGSGIDFLTIDGWDGGTATAPIALRIMYGKNIYEALDIAMDVLHRHGVRDRLKVFASSKLYAPHMSARAMAHGADAIGNARSIMIAGWCIRAGLCSGEKWPCPIGMTTMDPGKRRGYEQILPKKVKHIAQYIMAHNKGLIQAAAVAGLTSPHLFSKEHLAHQQK